MFKHQHNKTVCVAAQNNLTPTYIHTIYDIYCDYVLKGSVEALMLICTSHISFIYTTHIHTLCILHTVYI